jgi:putative nucleotidyltransferase with HDIG domain
VSLTELEIRRRGAVLDFAHELVQAVPTRLLHLRESQFVTDAMQSIVDALDRAERVGVELPLRLQFDGGKLFHEGNALNGPSLQARSLLERCEERDIAVLSFGRELNATELNRLFDLLLLPENIGAFARNNRDAAMCAFGIVSVRATLRSPGDPEDRSRAVADDASAMNSYQTLADTLQDNHQLAFGDHELSLDAAASAVEAALDELEEPSMLLSLAMQDDVDRFTVGHSVRVALLAMQVARGINATREQLVRVGAAALMHDIGKSKVPQEVLFKQGQLDDEEWFWMAQHPRLGAQILIEQHERVDPHTIGAAFCHHMSPRGGGYPEPMVPMEPSATSRLIRVCDVFEALTAVRPYKRALTPIEAFTVMHRQTCAFDERWLNTFVRTLGLFPTGTRVTLGDGSDGIVTGQSDLLLKPVVRLLTGPDGALLDSGRPDQVTIGDEVEGHTVRIAKVMTHDREVPIPEFDPDDSSVEGPTVHTACVGDHAHDDDPRP